MLPDVTEIVSSLVSYFIAWSTAASEFSWIDQWICPSRPASVAPTAKSVVETDTVTLVVVDAKVAPSVGAVIAIEGVVEVAGKFKTSSKALPTAKLSIVWIKSGELPDCLKANAPISAIVEVVVVIIEALESSDAFTHNWVSPTVVEYLTTILWVSV